MDLFDYMLEEGILLTYENNFFPQISWIGIKDGLIEEVSAAPISRSSAKEVIDARGMVVLPGLINGHCHGDMACSMGLGDGLTLAEQNTVMAPFNFLKDILTEEDRFRARRLSYLAAIKSGTTFVCENMYWSLGLKGIEAMSSSGIRGALCDDIRVDFMHPETFIGDDYLHSFRESCREAGIIPILGTISEEDFDTDLLHRIYEKRDQYGLLSTQHLSETDWRVTAVQEKYNLRPVEYLHHNNLLSDRIIGSHCVYIDQDEIAMMAQTGVKVVNTPLCEMKIADGVAPLPEFLKAGVPVGLGTDGAMWNNSSDMFREMKCAVLLQSLVKGPRALSAQDALRMGTIGGAEVFGIDAHTGSIRKGKDADIILLDMNQAHLQPLRMGRHENVASTVVFNATGQDVRHVLIRGVRVMQDRQVLTMNEAEILGQAREVSLKIAEHLPEDALGVS